MEIIELFDAVRHKSPANDEIYGLMHVREIRSSEEAEYHGSFEYMCRSSKTGQVLDFHLSELKKATE